MIANGQRIGYVRVSSIGQNTARQLDGIRVDRIFEDKCSGKDTNRPQLQAALAYCRAGDVLVVHSMDRLGRNMTDLLRLVNDLTSRGVVVEFVKEGQRFTGDDSPIAKLMLGLLGSVAEFERALILERQREGVQRAKAEGKYKGRKAILSESKIAEIQSRILAGEQKKTLAQEYGISRQTLYSALERANHYSRPPALSH